MIEWLWEVGIELWDYIRTNYDPVRDTVDIVAVTLGIYWLLLLIRGTRAGQILVGLLVLFTANFASETFGLVTLRSILATFMQSAIIIIVILFQHDIRRALARVGRGFFPSVSAQQESQILEEIVRAAQTLAQKRLGALIVLERETSLDDQIEGGQAVDAAVTQELITSLFVPYAPLHDGAVVIQRGRVALAGAILPLTLKAELPEGVGTRHRAAIGITEETDAIVVVVSEETKAISLVMGGEMARGLDAPRLRELLREILGGERRDLAGVGAESRESEVSRGAARDETAGARSAG